MPGKPYLLETAFRAVIPEGLQPFPCYGGRGRGEASGGENGIDRGLHQSGQAYAGNAEVNGERTTESDVE